LKWSYFLQFAVFRLNSCYYNFEVLSIEINSYAPSFLWGDFSGGENNGDKMKAIYSMGQICRIWQKEAKNGKKNNSKKRQNFFGNKMVSGFFVYLTKLL